MERPWQLYLLRCGDGTLYTGIALNAQKRFLAHQKGRGAKYTRGRGPLELVYTEVCPSHSDALKRELEVKAMSRADKERLIACTAPPQGSPMGQETLKAGREVKE